MIDHTENKRITDAATNGPWYAIPILNNTMIIHEHGEHETQEICEVYEDSNIEYITHFDKTYMQEYEARMIKLEGRVERYKRGLERIANSRPSDDADGHPDMAQEVLNNE
jgi:hypothetical protein